MTAPNYTPALTTILIHLCAQGLTAREISAKINRLPQSVSAKLQSLGLKAAKNPAHHRLKLDPVRFPTFCDVDQPDRDRHTGRRPMPNQERSLTGNSSVLCVTA